MVFNHLLRLNTILLCLGFSGDHEFYVSICYLKVIDSHQLEIRHRIFKDDLELAIREFQGDRAILLDSSHQEIISQYLIEVTSLEINHEKLTPEFIGMSIEGEGVTSAVECTFKVKMPAAEVVQMVFSSRVLIDHYDDQINMTHFISPEGRKSKNLDAKFTQFKII